ncbi:MAG: hypothetical protein LC808_08885, partial [Actinobacteria bacterium]|nr:hypothetical protein [Actinomycetota bacterium]
ALEQARAWLLQRTVGDRTRTARIWMITGVLAVVVGAAVTLGAATRADDLAERRNAVAPSLSTPFPVTARLDVDEIRLLRNELALDGQLPRGCSLPEVGSEVKAVAVGGSYRRPVLVIALPGCEQAVVRSSDPVSPPDPIASSASAVFVYLGEKDLAALHTVRDAAGAPPDDPCRPEKGAVVTATLVGGSLPRPTRLLIAGRQEDGRWSCPPVVLDVKDAATVAQADPPAGSR